VYILWHPRRTAVLYCGASRHGVVPIPTAHVTKNQLLYYYYTGYTKARPGTHTPAWYIIKNQRAIVLDGKTNLHNIFVYMLSRWERGRGMSSLKGFRYAVRMGSCVCVPAIYYGLVEGSLKIYLRRVYNI